MNRPSLRTYEILFLLCLTIAGFCVRFYGIDSLGLAEDEAAKWYSIQEYRQGHFLGVNPEHPLVMKMLAWGGLEVGARWNAWAQTHQLPVFHEETLMRLPNLFFGSLTAIVIYLLGKEMLGIVGGAAAAFFWTFTPLTIALNRILKEDTLATFFTGLALYLFWRGKKTLDDRPAGRLFVFSGIFFGLAIASKYYLHFIALNLLIWHIAGRAGLDHRPFFKPFGKRFWIAMALAFLIVNPVVLSPSHDSAILHYFSSKNIIHHGYNLNGHLYMNTIGDTPFGLPWYFYVWALGVKTPIPVLLLTVLGIFFIFKDRNSLTSIFLRVMLVFLLVPFSLVASKWIRYLLDILPFVFFAAGYGVEKIYAWLCRLKWPSVRRFGLAAAVLVLAIVPAAETIVWAPLYPMYLNPLGGGRANMARIFPHDELYDIGVREAVEFTCKIAPQGALLAASNPKTVSYYLHKCGRADIRVGVLYDPKYVVRRGDYLLIQESRRYFETEDLFQEVEHHGQDLRDVSVAGVITARIYRF
jgi:hypothetical protein